MTSQYDGIDFRVGSALTGDIEHDLVANALIDIEERIETGLGWDVEPGLFLLSADPHAGEATTELIPTERWRPNKPDDDPVAALVAFAESFGEQRGFWTRKFEDSPAGRCAFAFMAEGWSVKRSEPNRAQRRQLRRGAAPLAPLPEQVLKRFVSATDIGGRRYMVARERGAEAKYFSVTGSPTGVIERIPRALWTLTGALASGAFEL